mmetsp:Transcript_5067/g.7527  ORF Transcript_5067/g.7527 Transcript_5067/m.7527 type:complete len:293 (+) Transcript_5067:30-908(+)
MALIGGDLYQFIYKKEMPVVEEEEEEEELQLNPDGAVNDEEEMSEDINGSLLALENENNEIEEEEEEEDDVLESDEDDDLVERDSDLESDEENDLVMEDDEEEEQQEEALVEEEQREHDEDDDEEIEDDEGDDNDVYTGTQDGNSSAKLVPMFPDYSRLPEMQVSKVDPETIDDEQNPAIKENGPEYFNYGFNHDSWREFVKLQLNYRKEHPKAPWTLLNQFDPLGRDINDPTFRKMKETYLHQKTHHDSYSDRGRGGNRSPMASRDFDRRRGRPDRGNRTPNRRPPKRSRR